MYTLPVKSIPHYRPDHGFRTQFICLFFIFFISASPAFAAEENKEVHDTYKDLETFANSLSLIQQYYVDPVNTHKIMNGAINGMLSSLDPHSGYLTPDEYKELEEETSGSFTGVGIEVSLRDGVLTAVAPIEDTPAAKLGIQPGDQIIRINGVETKELSLMDAVNKMRGPKGSKVVLSIRRASWPDSRDFTLVREVIPLHSVKSMVINPGYGYLRISNFQDSTTQDVQSALDDLRSQHALKGLVLDLRNNPGGLLDQAIKVADIFLDHGVIVSTRGRNNREQILYEAHPNAKLEQFPMIVLINGGSASGSEIVAGALKDQKRAKVLGTTSFGKGSVQTIIPLPDGAAIRLTTAKYYTPSGASIQATGIRPDIAVQLQALPGHSEAPANQRMVREKDLPGHLQNDTSAVSDAKDEKDTPDKGAVSGDLNQEETFQEVNSITNTMKRLEQDSQLRRALEVLEDENTAITH